MLTDTQPYWLSLIKFQAYCAQNNIGLFLHVNKLSHISYAREDLLMQVKDKEYDYLLWIDADQSFEPEQVMKLIKNDVDVCCGIIKMVGTQSFAVGWLKENLSAVYIQECYLEEYEKENVPNPQEIDFLGFGFTLIKKKVIDALKPPYFPNDGTRCHMIPEDMSFFLKVTDAGFKCYVDRYLRIPHWKLLPII